MGAEHELGRQVVGVHVGGSRRHLAPADHAQERQVDADEQHDHQQGAQEDGARDVSSGVAHLLADVTNVVIAEVGVHGQDHGPAQGGIEVGGQGCTGKFEGDLRVEACRALHENPTDHREHTEPDRESQPFQAGHAAVQQCQDQDADADGDEPAGAERQGQLAVPRQGDGARPGFVERAIGGMEAVGEDGDGDEPGAEFQRPADEELPDEEERRQPAPAAPAVGFEEVQVRPTGAGKRCAEFAPDQAVHEHQGARADPAKQGKRPR